MTIRHQPLAALLVSLALGAAAIGCAEGRAIEPTPNVCGDGEVGGVEQCDDGENNSDRASGACRTTCVRPVCGDGVTDPGEECDDRNTANGDGCDASCRNAYICGDAQCSEALGESCSVCESDCCPCGDGECSQGELCGECPRDCCPDCGNGTLDAGEACDDGNNDEGDGCGIGCSDEDGVATCGNGIREAGEACEDGNTVGADGCGAECQLEYFCGDAVCELDVGEDCGVCPTDCCPNCGDGIINDFEQCDGGLPPGFPTCLDLCFPAGVATCPGCMIDYSTCQGDLPECGNGVAECGEVCDGGDLFDATCANLGFDGGDLACTPSCTADVRGCGERLYYYRESFDEGCPADWLIGYPWACGAPTGGPGAAYSLPNALTTGLAGSYPGNQQFSTAIATSPTFDLTGATNPSVAFRVWHELEAGADFFQVSVSTDGETFSVLSSTVPAYGSGQGWTGETSGWESYTASLAAYVGEPQLQLRFAFQSDSSDQQAGAFVDDVLVAEQCGNGIVDSGEVCDGDALGDEVCPESTCGVPTCAADCQSADVASCVVPECGDGVRECEETCDEDDLTGNSCSSIGFDGGDLGCSSSCEYDVSGCGELQLLLPLQSFETCPPAGWTLGGTWECGVPTNGPASANTGTGVIATNLDADYPPNCEYDVDFVQTPPFYVAGDAPRLGFYAWMWTEASWDGMHLEISEDGGASWDLLTTVDPAYTDNDIGLSSAWDDQLTSWRLYTADLSAYLGESVRVRFAFYSDAIVQREGVFIDDVVAVPDLEAFPVVLATPPAQDDLLVGEDFALTMATVSPGAVTWSISAESNGAWLGIDADTGVLSGTPNVGDVGPVSVTVRGERATDPANFAEVTVDFAVVDIFYEEDFEPCDGSYLLTSSWECGPVVDGPAACHSGVGCLGTNGYENGLAWGSTTAESPSIDLDGAVNPALRYWFWQNVESGYDGTRLEISVDGGAWTLLQTSLPYEGTLLGQACWDNDYSTWVKVTADLSPYAGQSVAVRWSLRSDSIVDEAGPFIDDVIVTTE